MTTLQLLIDGRHVLGECVLWCDRTQRVFWTDIPAASLWCHSPTNGTTQHFAMPERLACFALTDDDDRLLLGLASGLAFFNFSDGRITPICSVESDLPTTRINDGRCDRQGRFVFGMFNQSRGNAPIGSFYRLNLDLTLDRLPLDPVGIANSICFSIDGRTMYHCDSAARKILCCDYDPVTGEISRDRLFVDLSMQSAVPDGSTVDAQGYIWNAQWGGNRVVRYAPDGSVERTIEVPVSQPSCVALGGTGLDQLFVTTARLSLPESELEKQPHAGGIFHAVLDGIKGLPEVRFKGV